jgi:hypothetical protein
MKSSPAKRTALRPWEAAEKRAEATSKALWDVCSTMEFYKGLWAGSIAKLFFSRLLVIEFGIPSA